MVIWVLFQNTIRCLIIRSHEVSKPWDWYLELSDHSEIWQAPQQHCCRGACQFKLPISRLQGFTKSYDKKSNPILKWGPGLLWGHHGKREVIVLTALSWLETPEVITWTTSMGWCKKDVTPLLTHWSYVFLAINLWYNLWWQSCHHNNLSLSVLSILTIKFLLIPRM